MNLDRYPELLSKTHLGRIFGISIWSVNRRIAKRWNKEFEWIYDEGKLKATKSSVEPILKRQIEKARKDMLPPTPEEATHV